MAAGLLSSFCVVAQQPAQPSDDLIRLSNGRGMTAVFTAFGARLVRLKVPGKDGKPVNVVWGFDSTGQYHRCLSDPYYGAIIGRYGTRIARGRFSLDGKSYQLDVNDGLNSLHGGQQGFHTKDWTIISRSGHSVTFGYRSTDGEEGYPGNLDVKVTYTLTKDNALHIAYEAQTDQPTVLNLTNHAYWNLNGTGSGDILGHRLLIYSSNYLPVDSTLIPLGKPASVIGASLLISDREWTIGERINITDKQLRNGKGYDHNFVLDAHDKQQPVAEVAGDKSGIRLDIYTDQPGLQFYSGNFMAGKNRDERRVQR